MNILISNWDEFLIPYRQAVNELKVKLTAIAEEYRGAGVHSPIESVEGRVKRIGSILEKANRKGIPYGELAEKIEDIAGIRVICRFVEDIERVLELLRKRDGFDMRIIEERDYINNAKPSGYQSYHVHIKYRIMSCGAPKDIWAEIQIRTLAMNFWATIEHSLKYKYNNEIPEDVKSRLKKSAQAASALDAEMSKIRHEITEAHEVILVKNDLVESIMEKIQGLYATGKLENANELNREFIDIYQECELPELLRFNEKVNTLAHIYKAENISSFLHEA